MFPRIQGYLYNLTKKRVQNCGENSTGLTRQTIIENGVTNALSGGVKVDIEDNVVALEDPPLQSDDPGHTTQCTCPNCKELIARFSECNICLEPLQGQGPYVCSVCGGMWCERCTRKMPRCPWCRAALRTPAVPHAFLQKFLNDAMLPCRNYRRGCEVLLTATERVAHEENCKYDGIICPASLSCSLFQFDEISSHLNDKHDVVAVYSPKVKILIEKFESKLKMTSSCKMKYKIVLLYNKSAFVIRVLIYNYQVKVAIMRKNLGYCADKCESKNSLYSALIEFESTKGSTKSALLVENGAYSKKSEAQWTESIVTDMDDSITINVAVGTSGSINRI